MTFAREGRGDDRGDVSAWAVPRADVEPLKAGLSEAGLISLQRSAGNAAVGRLLADPRVQLSRAGVAGIYREPPKTAAPPAPHVVGVIPDVNFEDVELAEWDAGPLKITPSLGGSVSVKPSEPGEGEEKEKSSPLEIKSSPGADKNRKLSKIKVEAEKKFAPTKWGIRPKLGTEVEFSKEGAKLSVSGGLEHEGFKAGALTFGPVEINTKAFEFETGKKPHILFVEAKGKVSAPTPALWTYDGASYQVVPTLSLAFKFEPNYAELLKYLGRAASGSIGSALPAAGAILGPFAVGAAMLAMWAKAGHELDDFHRSVRRARAGAKAAANVACGRPWADGLDTFEILAAAGQLEEIKNNIAPAITKKVSELAHIPPGLVAEAARGENSSIRDILYGYAWQGAWPDIKKAWLEAFKDTTFSSHKLERMTIESFDGGEFSKGF